MDDMAGDIRFPAKPGNGISVDPWIGASRENEYILRRSIENEGNQIGDRTPGCDCRGNNGSDALSHKEDRVISAAAFAGLFIREVEDLLA